MAGERFLLKDFFNPDSIGIIADAVEKHYAEFDREGFIAAVFDEEWEDRELKQRMRHVSASLRTALPDDFEEALAILVEASPDTAGAGFAAMVMSDFVEAYGIDHFDPSVDALAVFTRVVSAEFAVRPFLNQYPDAMLARMGGWAADQDPALRRLASEGTRPRLPWGTALKQFQADPSPIIPLLAELSHDPSEDVRRSVANNLNDISKDHPDLVVDILESWQDGTDEVADITGHALRVLIKKGHPAALELLGFDPAPNVRVEQLAVDPPLAAIGGKVTVSFSVRSTGDSIQPIVIDGVVHFARPNGTSTRVFKWKTAQLEPGETLPVRRTVTLQQLSTRRVHPGTHRIEVQVNGSIGAAASFEVSESG